MIRYGAKKDKAQLEIKMTEFQDITRKGGNLLLWMRQSTKVKEVEETDEEMNERIALERETWTDEQMKALKEGLKLHAKITDPKEKFKLIANMITDKN